MRVLIIEDETRLAALVADGLGRAGIRSEAVHDGLTGLTRASTESWDAIVLGGGLSKLPFLYTEGRAAVAKAVFNDEFVTPIVPARHGDSSGVLGAARLWPLDTDPSR